MLMPHRCGERITLTDQRSWQARCDALQIVMTSFIIRVLFKFVSWITDYLSLVAG